MKTKVFLLFFILLLMVWLMPITFSYGHDYLRNKEKILLVKTSPFLLFGGDFITSSFSIPLGVEFQINKKLSFEQDISYLFPVFNLGLLIDSLDCDTANADFAFTINCLFNNVGKMYKINNAVNNNLNIKIYPNPSDGIFNVITSITDSTQLNFTVSNYLGEPVSYSSSISNSLLVLNLTGNPKGVYLLKITYNNNINFFKLILL